MKKTKIRPLLTKNGVTLHLRRVRHAKTLAQRFQGLMGVSPGDHDYALVFHLPQKTKIGASIHMLFMKIPIDVLWLDKNKRIVDWIKQLQPWTLNYTPKREAKYIVELPAGTIKRHNFRDNSRIEW